MNIQNLPVKSRAAVMKFPHIPIKFEQFYADHSDVLDSDVIVEMPVSLTVNGQVWLTFMCTPVDLEAMAIGFLYNEGLIKNLEDIASVHVCSSGDNVDIWLYKSLQKPEKWRRTSGCTGGITFVEDQFSPVIQKNGNLVSALKINNLLAELFESQVLYRASGGVHTSALSDGERIRLQAEDIGRHNTLDKIAGKILLDPIDLPRKIIITTGRISSEMLQKSARLDASIVISRTSPSSLSIEMAERWGITLIGYARRNRFNVYTHSHRIILTPDKAEIKESVHSA